VTASETPKKEETKIADKPPVKRKIIRAPKAKMEEQIVDYSHLYNTFYDIFVGF